MASEPPILEIDGLRKAYDTGHRAVDGLSLRVRRGSIFGFIGLNGAGKTTTIRIIAGLLGHDAGTVTLFGRALQPQDREMKRDIGVVLDEPLYFDWMSAPEYLRFVGIMEGLPEEVAENRARELLQFLDLSEKAGDPIESYSTGMKKKVSLAAAVIHTPKLVILDEPLEGIDALAARAIKETLAMMASRGTTVFITSHVLDTVEKFCTDIAIVHRGRVVLECRTAEIRKRAQGARAKFASLEELFIDTVSDKTKRRHLSFL